MIGTCCKSTCFWKVEGILRLRISLTSIRGCEVMWKVFIWGNSLIPKLVSGLCAPHPIQGLSPDRASLMTISPIAMKTLHKQEGCFSNRCPQGKHVQPSHCSGSKNGLVINILFVFVTLEHYAWFEWKLQHSGTALGFLRLWVEFQF